MCGSKHTRKLGVNLDFNTDIYKCANCNFIQNDYVSNHQLQEYYRTQYRSIGNKKITEDYLEFMTLRAHSQKEFIGPIVAQDNACVLDIGAGVGKLLEQFVREGVSTFAVEADMAMLEHLSQLAEVQVFMSDKLFLNDPYNQVRFSLIIMSHVFEHINDPITYLYKLASIIEPGGYLFLEVPNEPEEIINHYLNKKKRGIGHLFDFTVETISNLIGSANVFQIIKISTYGIRVKEYISGTSIKEFRENETGDGIWIRILLKKLSSTAEVNN